MTIFDITLFGLHIAPSYYGLMYAIGFIAGYLIIKNRGKIKGKPLEDLFLYVFLGVVLGGRFGFILFYDFLGYINHPLNIIKIWEGGMSFHGGVIGVIISMILFARKNKINFYLVADEITAILPIGLGLGRIGNYLNKELLGFPNYYGPFAVLKNNVSYFPSPLVESLLEGLVLYFILRYFYIKKSLNNGQLASLFLIYYGFFRIFVEIFFREPDVQIGYILGFLTMGEILSFPMILAGFYFYRKCSKKIKL